MLAEGPEPEQVAVACRFLAHMLSVLRCADRLYGSAVQAAVQLAAEVEQDVQEMLRLGADPRRREQVGVHLVRVYRVGCVPAEPVLLSCLGKTARWRSWQV